MTGCLPTMTHPLYGYGKQEKNEIIEVRVSEKINYLTERSTKNYLAITQGTLFTFDAIALPDDLIRCNEQRCHMTGTLYITPNDGVVGAITSKVTTLKQCLVTTTCTLLTWVMTLLW